MADGGAFWPSAGFWYLKLIFELLPDEAADLTGALAGDPLLELSAWLFCRSRCVSCAVAFEVLAAAFGVATVPLR